MQWFLCGNLSLILIYAYLPAANKKAATIIMEVQILKVTSLCVQTSIFDLGQKAKKQSNKQKHQIRT